MDKKDALENIGWAAKQIRQANERAERYVAEARQAGASWAAIGAQLGISRQAAQQRYGKGTA